MSPALGRPVGFDLDHIVLHTESVLVSGIFLVVCGKVGSWVVNGR